MRVTGIAQRDAWRARTMPPVEEVRPDLWSVPVPIPASPLRYTLAYVFVAASGVVVVDPGWDSEPGWAALVAGLAAAGTTIADVTGVVATHVHPDHHGLSGRLRAESGAWVAMHPVERDSLPARLWDETGRDGDGGWLRSCGIPEQIITELTVTREHIASFLDMAEPDLVVEHGELLPLADRRLRAVWTPGHTPGHLCIHDEVEDVLLTGDHLLPRITPNIGLHPHHEARDAQPPLGAYLSSLELTAGFDTAEALPAHEYRFRGMAARSGALRRHHERRCEEIIEVLTRLGAATVWQVTEQLSWSQGWQAVTGLMRRAAVAESAAHLRHLLDRQQIRCATRRPATPVLFTTTLAPAC